MAEGELAGLGLADHHGAGGREQADERGVGAGAVAAVDRRAVLRRQPGGVEDVLHADRHPDQGKRRRGLRRELVELAGAIDRGVARRGREGSNRPVELCDRDVRTGGHLDAAQPALADQADDLGGTQLAVGRHGARHRLELTRKRMPGGRRRPVRRVPHAVREHRGRPLGCPVRARSARHPESPAKCTSTPTSSSAAPWSGCWSG